MHATSETAGASQSITHTFIQGKDTWCETIKDILLLKI